MKRDGHDMKRLIGILLVGGLTLLISGCSSNKELLSKDQTAQKYAEVKQNVEIIHVVFPLLNSMPKDMALIQEEINKITMKKMNAKVNFIGIDNINYPQQCRLMLASQEKMDLILTGTIGPFGYSRQVANGQLLDMSSLVESSGSDIKAALGEFMDVGTIEGKIYGVPTLRDEATSAGFAIRKDLVDKYKIDLSKVKELKDIEPILKIIQDHEPGLAPFFPAQEAMSGIEAAMRISGGDPLSSDYYFSGVLMNAQDPEFEVVNYYETQECYAMFKLIRHWNKSGYLLPNILTNDDGAYTLVRAGKVASFLQNTKPGIEGQISKQCAREMIVVPLTPTISNTLIATGFMWGIPAYSKMPDKAMEFLNLMYSDRDLVNLMDWGIEGKHYIQLEDGTIDYPVGINASNTGYNMNQGFLFGNQMLSYVWKGDPVDLWEQMDHFNRNAIKSEALGFFFNTTPIEAEFTACTSIWQEYQKALGVGAVDPDEVLPEFIQRLKAAGVDRIVAEKQRQLDLWAKQNRIR